MSGRPEHDTLGEVKVPADCFWGAQTQRALTHFDISTEKMPLEVIRALAALKRAAAEVNAALGRLDGTRANAIVQAAQQVLDGRCDSHFPLHVWQSGSGTQTHMNMNEVLAHLATDILRQNGQDGLSVHAHDHVNLGQSSNDVFPSAMHVAAALSAHRAALPHLQALHATIVAKAMHYQDLIKIGRTHLQDAVPLTLGQEFSGHAAQLHQSIQRIEGALQPVYELPLGGTAVGTGLNTHPEFGQRVAAQISVEMKLPFKPATNAFAYIAAHDALVHLHAALKTCAVSLMKIANDVRWLASGPRCGLGELTIPANEPGSSIMPGKVNPSQCEALMMACGQIIGNDVAVTLGGAGGNFELNAFKPLLAHNLMQSLRLLSDGVDHFHRHCWQGLTANETRIHSLVEQSLMLVTALTPHIGYDEAAAIAQLAQGQGVSLRQAAIQRGLTPEALDAWLDPRRMV